MGHQTKLGPNPILLWLQQLAESIHFSVYATAKQFALKELMQRGVKGFLKI